MRTVARETLFKLIFSTQFVGEIDKGLKNRLYKEEKLSNDDISYCDRMLVLLDEHGGELIKEIDKRSLLFPESNIFPADKSILLISLCEIKYCDDIPAKVSMNEAANIASKYSSTKSATFITGILSAISEGK